MIICGAGVGAKPLIVMRDRKPLAAERREYLRPTAMTSGDVAVLDLQSDELAQGLWQPGNAFVSLLGLNSRVK
jgi:hypothetical protein